MKRVILAFVLACIVIGGSFWSHREIDLLSQELANHVLQADALVEQQDTTEAYAVLSETYGLWKQHEVLLGSLLHHDELDDIEKFFLKSLQYMRSGQQPEYFVETIQLHAMLTHLPELIQPIMKNLL